jgi:hypothetical protein
MKIKVLGGFGVVDTRKACTSLSYQKGWPKMCCRPIKAFRDGKGYCGIHDPVHQAEMQRRRDEKAACV